MLETSSVTEAARALREGRVIAFPTETVYGLGAAAGNEAAVRRIFELKGRPTSHPLIIHVAGKEQLHALASEVPERALRLAEAFWPGPLTLVLQKSRAVLPIVTGGQSTVAVRVPSHPLALALLVEFGAGVAAPSANRFGRVSATTAEHVRRDFGSSLDLLLDGGAASIGIESTIVDVSRGAPRLLRLGGATAEAIERVLGEPLAIETQGPVRVPGQLASHYAPRAELVLVTAAELAERAEALSARGARVAAMLPEGTPAPHLFARREIPQDPDRYARKLYAWLRELDERGPDVILVVPPTSRGIGQAVIDRLERAAAPR